MLALGRKLIFVRLPMTFGTVIEVVDQNGLTTSFGDNIAYSIFAEGLSALAANNIDVTLIDADGTAFIGSLDDLDAADRAAITEALADAAEIAGKTA